MAGALQGSISGSADRLTLGTGMKVPTREAASMSSAPHTRRRSFGLLKAGSASVSCLHSSSSAAGAQKVSLAVVVLCCHLTSCVSIQVKHMPAVFLTVCQVNSQRVFFPARTSFWSLYVEADVHHVSWLSRSFWQR